MKARVTFVFDGKIYQKDEKINKYVIEKMQLQLKDRVGDYLVEIEEPQQTLEPAVEDHVDEQMEEATVASEDKKKQGKK